MKESDFIKKRAEAELKAEPLVRIFRQSLIEMYMKGYTDALEDTYNEKAAEKRLVEEAEALAESPDLSAVRQVAKELNAVKVQEEEPLVRLKPNAILKRRLHPNDDFSTRTSSVIKSHDIKTLGDIIKYSEADFLTMRGCGKVCLNEIKKFVGGFGLKLVKR